MWGSVRFGSLTIGCVFAFFFRCELSPELTKMFDDFPCVQHDFVQKELVKLLVSGNECTTEPERMARGRRNSKANSSGACSIQ